MAYLDHNASAMPDHRAAKAAAEWLLGAHGNPSSIHGAGRQARRRVEAARRQLAGAIGAAPAELFFTSGATEAIYTAIQGTTSPGDHVLVSALEHPAVWAACKGAEVDLEVVPCDAAGRISPGAFAERLRPTTKLAVMMLAQNEIGNIYPVRDVAETIGQVPLLCDAVQALGKMPLDVSQLGAKMVALSGHKVGAPAGVGALWCEAGFSVGPLIEGGGQERGRRGGTENISGIVGLGVAAQNVPERLQRAAEICKLRDALRVRLKSRFEDFIEHGDPSNRLSNTLSFRIGRLEGGLLAQSLDLSGFQVATGSACSSGGTEPSPVLLALGLDKSTAKCGLRVSLGPETKQKDVDGLVKALSEAVDRANGVYGLEENA